MNIVTGYKGFIGGALYQRLKRDNKQLKGYEHNAIPIVECISTIYHLGAIAGIADCKSKPLDCITYNIESTADWVEIAGRSGSRLVFASTCGLYGDHLYGISKLACERIIKDHAEDRSCILRLANVYGPGSLHKNSLVAKMCKDALKTGVIKVHGDGQQTRDFVHVDDVVSAFLNAPRTGTYMVSTGIPTKVIDIAELIAANTGAEIVFKTVEPEVPPRPAPPVPWFNQGYVDWETGVLDTLAWFESLQQ